MKKIYLQSKESKSLFHTVREFTDQKEAEFWLEEFRRCFPWKKYYLSSRPCKSWKHDKKMIELMEAGNAP